MKILKYYNRDKKEGISFNEFCYYLDNLYSNNLPNLSLFDPHWKPQNLIIGNVKKSILVKMEDPNKDYVFNKLTGLNLPFYHSGEKKGCKFDNKRNIDDDFSNFKNADFMEKFSKGERPHYRSFYNDENIRIVNKIYSKDFELLGYPMGIKNYE